MAKDLLEHRGRSIVVPGDHQPAIVHALAHAMNGVLGNVWQTVIYAEPFTPSEKTQTEQLRELVADIDSGRVKMLVILGGNPAYNTPTDLKLSRERFMPRDGEDKIPLRIHVGEYFDETAELCHWHVPQKHFLESWGDTRAYDGTVSIVQPLIQPLYDSHSFYEVLQLFFRENFDQKDYDIVRGYWQSQNINMGAPAAISAPASNSSPAATPSPPAQNGAHGAAPAPAPAQSATNTQTRPAAAPANTQTRPAAAPATTAQASPTGTTPAQRAAGGARSFEDNWRKIVHDGVVPNTA